MKRLWLAVLGVLALSAGAAAAGTQTPGYRCTTKVAAQGVAISICAPEAIDVPTRHAPSSPANAMPGRMVAPPQPRREPAGYVSETDYPDAALLAKEEGRVAFSVEIGIDGHASNCMVTSSSGSSDLDASTCRLMVRRGRYTPARDNQGMPMSARIEQELNWKLPNGR
jgi:protein TonB